MSERTTLWFAKGQELLADGEWHLGVKVLLAIAQAVPPQFGLRHMEAERQRQGQAEDRMVSRQQSTLIAMGQRGIAHDVISSCVRRGRWETDCGWPPPTWRPPEATWQLRDVFALRESVTSIAQRCGISPGRLKRVLVEAAVPFTHTARTIHLYPPYIARAEELAKIALEESRERNIRMFREANVRRRQN